MYVGGQQILVLTGFSFFCDILVSYYKILLKIMACCALKFMLLVSGVGIIASIFAVIHLASCQDPFEMEQQQLYNTRLAQKRSLCVRAV